MEPWRTTFIKQEPTAEDSQRSVRGAMGLARIMDVAPARKTAPNNDNKSSASSSDAATTGRAAPGQDIILSTLHQLLDPDLQPPPPRSQQLPRRPAASAPTLDAPARGRSDKSYSSHHKINPPSKRTSSSSFRSTARAAPSSYATDREMSDRDQRHHDQSSGAPSRTSAPNSSSTPRLSYREAEARTQPHPVKERQPLADQAPGFPATLDPAAVQHLLQASLLSGLSPQAILAALAPAQHTLPAAAADLVPPAGHSNAYQRHKGAPTATPAALPRTTPLMDLRPPSSSSVHRAHGSTQPAPSTAHGPHIPDPLYPRPPPSAKAPLPTTSQVPSLVPSATSAFTCLRRSPPSSPNPQPSSSQSAGAPKPSNVEPAPSPAQARCTGSGGPDLVAPGPIDPHTSADYQMRVQHYMQLLLLLQSQQHQQSQAPPGYAAGVSLPYSSAPMPMVPMITTPLAGLDPSPSTSSITSSQAGKGMRGTKGGIKSEDDRSVRKHGRPREGGVTASRFSAQAGGDTGRKRRLEDLYGSAIGAAQVPGPASAQEGAVGDDDDTVKRKRINQNQLDVLEAAYLDDPLPSRRTKQRLSSQLGISIKRVQIWFQNRRAKQKRQKKDGSDDGAGDGFPEDGSDDPPSSGMFGLMDL